jgi:hypothetical protein
MPMAQPITDSVPVTPVKKDFRTMRKLAVFLATTIALVPQIANACTGSACSSYTYANKQFKNNDRDLKIHITGCVIQSGGTCGYTLINFDIFVEPQRTSNLNNVPASLGSNVKVDVKTAAFVGALQQPHVATVPPPPTSGPGTLITQEFSTVTVNNTGKMPLKVVILDMGKIDIGRTPDYKSGSLPPITLKMPVSKYHWEVFAPGDVEPCQIGHDETKSSITVGCQRSKADEKLPIALPRLILGTKWVDKCAPAGGPFGAGGAVATCCSRQRRAEAACQATPGTLDNSGSCDVAERTCQETVLERAPSR